MYDFDTIINRSGTGSLKWDKYKSTDILPFWVADMDFVSPSPILDALKARTEHGVFGYTIPYEHVEQSVINYMKRVHDYEVEREWLVWLPGLVPGLNVASAAFGEANDSVMTATPVYPPFLSAPQNQNRKLITNDLLWDGNRYTFDWEAMEKSVSSDTRLFILCNPHNPLGRVFDEDELRQLADFCKRHDMLLCSDEIHCDLVLDEDVKHTCTATLSQEVAQRTLTFMAPSKTYNIAGLSCSFAIIENAKVRNAFKRAASGFITEVNAFGYTACASAYNECEPWRKELIAYLRDNRDYLYAFFANHMPEIKLRPMQATYLAWLDISALGLEVPDEFFEKHGVGLSSGSYFGNKDFLRLNFGCPRSRLEEGLKRMASAVKSL